MWPNNPFLRGLLFLLVALTFYMVLRVPMERLPQEMIQVLLKHSRERGYERMERVLLVIQSMTHEMMRLDNHPDEMKQQPPQPQQTPSSMNDSLLISEIIQNNNTQCQQELITHIITLNYATEFYSSLLSNSGSQSEHEQKASRIVQDLITEYANTTTDKCGTNHSIPILSLGIQLNSREELIRKRELWDPMSGELIEKIENLMEEEMDSSQPQRNKTDLTRHSSCAKTVVEVLIAREILLSISKTYAIPGVEKGVNFYLSLKLRAHCSRTNSLIKKSHNILKDYSSIVSEDIKNELYSLFKVSEKVEMLAVTPQGKNLLLKLNNDRITNNKIEELLQQITHLNIQIEQLKNQNEKHISSSLETESILKNTIRTKNEEISILHKKLLEKDDKISNHKDQISELEEKVHALTEIAESQKITKSILEKNLTLLEDYLQTLNQTTTSIIEKKDQQIQQILLVKTMQEETITNLQNDLKLAEQRISSLHNTHQEEMKKQAEFIETLQKEITHLKHEKSEQFERIETLKQTTLRVMLNEKEEILRQSAQLQQTAQHIAQISSYMGQFNETINEENEKIKGQLKIFLDKLEKKQQCQKTTNELRKNLCREDKTKLIQDKQVEKLILKVTSLEKQIELLSNEKQALILRVGECSSNVTELEKLFKECSDKSATLSSIVIETKLEHVEEQKKCKNNVEELESRLNEVMTEMNNMQSQSSEENSHHIKELSALNDHLQECQLKTQGLITENSNLTLSLQELTLSVHELEKQNLELASAHVRTMIQEEESMSELRSENHTKSIDEHSKDSVETHSSHQEERQPTPQPTGLNMNTQEELNHDLTKPHKKEEEIPSSSITNETHEEEHDMAEVELTQTNSLMSPSSSLESPSSTNP
ncbi:hypothetical protein FDP41_009163 [Naegleria fowleri]|uniref:Uncharacterized protein n=1 Tax=Naegleria fowleri TaxID=5763 RepID=A0A6A5BF48_NAEFO|nr:uncharacterized protein FDP41_009163 [Naegleria fowleri]KAF0972558.1 hypothetical protein FDP41_009163 [Naegleria fowleri]